MEKISLSAVQAHEQQLIEVQAAMVKQHASIEALRLKTATMRAHYEEQQKATELEKREADRLVRQRRADERLALAAEREARQAAKYEATKPKVYDNPIDQLRADLLARRAEDMKEFGQFTQITYTSPTGLVINVMDDVDITDELLRDLLNGVVPPGCFEANT